MTPPEPFLSADPIAEAEALVAAGDAAGAVALLQHRIAAGRGGVLARLALGRALLAAGRLQDAVDVARETSALAPGIADVAVALGEALLAAGHLPTAIAEFQRALRLSPESDLARLRLGCAWLDAGEAQRALDMFSEIAPFSGVDAERTAKIAQAEEILAAPRSAAGYVRHLFDQFSADYDSRMLGTLSYQAPSILRALSDLLLGGRGAPLEILDLGCGTGLSGLAFRDLADGGRLDGVDLSPLMVERAAGRGIYDALEVGDLETILAAPGQIYDLLLAADTLVYLGDLAPLFAGAARRLRKTGFFLFTVERADAGSFELGPKRRYRHTAEYVRNQAAAAGFEVVGLMDCAPRHEAGLPVEGLAAALQRS